MFTIKVLRRNKSGAERRLINNSEYVQVYGGGEDWLHGGAKAVMWLEHETGNWPCVTVDSEEPKDDDHWPAQVIYIENSQGQTTEIVRAT